MRSAGKISQKKIQNRLILWNVGVCELCLMSDACMHINLTKSQPAAMCAYAMKLSICVWLFKWFTWFGTRTRDKHILKLSLNGISTQ